MKRIAVVLLLCLLIAGTVSAVAINPALVGAAKTIAPAVEKNGISVSRVPVTLVTQPGRGMLEVYSVPSGAIVTLDGNTNPGEKTPIKYSLFAGPHTVVLSLAGYQNYTETFNLDVGAVRDINADMKLTGSGSLAQAGALQVSGARTLVTQPSPVSNGRNTPEPAGKPVTFRTLDVIPGAVTRAPTIPVPATTVPTIDYSCPNSQWSCLMEDDAVQQFGYPNARYGDGSCGYELLNNTFVLKYCFQDIPSSQAIFPGALAASGVKKGDTIFIMNKTWIERDVVGTSPAGQDTGNGGLFQPVFNFFSDVFGGGTPRPELNLQLVELNPCPEPPMGEGPLAGRLK
jgi:hypothetical protein